MAQSTTMILYDVIGFDADDTLWQCEDDFRYATHRFVELLTPFSPVGVDITAALTATERKNLGTYGYGVKGFTINMLETALTISDNTVPAHVVAELVKIGRGLLEAPVKILPHVPEVLERVGARHKLVLITKGDLQHQTHKISTSGLTHHFDHLEIVLEKDTNTYAGLLQRWGVAPDRFLMVGNSVHSDILPVMAIGGHAVHVPYHLTWELDHVEHNQLVTEIASLSELPHLLSC
jgi:putative hydrolase of the HAD superfamily